MLSSVSTESLPDQKLRKFVNIPVRVGKQKVEKLKQNAYIQQDAC